MQEALEPAAAGRRPAQQFAGVDLRRPKGYASPPAAPASQEAAPAAAEGDPCPRCESRDTKFCYYNNYNTSQPRHFCKGCRRYWTKGGTLRNVPVGGGTRKKPSSSSSSPPSSYAAAAKPKRPYKKKRRVTPPEPSAPVSADSAKATTATTITPATTETTTAAATITPKIDATSETTAELLVTPAAEDDSFAHLLHSDDAVALGLGLSDLPTGKSAAILEPDSFEWPATFDLGACWGGAGFADSDPAIFLNLP